MGTCLSSCTCDSNEEKSKQKDWRTESGNRPDPLVGASGPNFLEASFTKATKHSQESHIGNISSHRNSMVKKATSEKASMFSYPKLTLGKGGSSGSAASGDSPPTGAMSAVSEAKISALFDRYAEDPGSDHMHMDGIERLCADLRISPDEFRILVLAWRCAAARMCVLSRVEFSRGCVELRAESLDALRDRLTRAAEAVAADASSFRDLYRFAFRFGLEENARTLPVPMAAALWRLVFSPAPPRVLDRWLLYLEKTTHVKGIPRDTWNMFLHFVQQVGDDLSVYDDAEAWPSLFDDFVEYETDACNQNTASAADFTV